MMSRLFASVNPVAVAAQPEYEFSMDTTTGMSAPPIGRMSNTPSVSASKMRARSETKWSCRTKSAPSPSITSARARFSRCCPLNTSGLLGIRACSLPKATAEPVKVTAPMKLPAKISDNSTMLCAPLCAWVR